MVASEDNCRILGFALGACNTQSFLVLAGQPWRLVSASITAGATTGR